MKWNIRRASAPRFVGVILVTKKIRSSMTNDLWWFVQAAATPPPVEKAPKKTAAKPAETKGKTVHVADEKPLDPDAEKLRQQRFASTVLMNLILVNACSYSWDSSVSCNHPVNCLFQVKKELYSVFEEINLLVFHV